MVLLLSMSQSYFKAGVFNSSEFKSTGYSVSVKLELFQVGVRWLTAHYLRHSIARHEV
jgi:hypothetical protein